jgi:hypothetical protein
MTYLLLALIGAAFVMQEPEPEPIVVIETPPPVLAQQPTYEKGRYFRHETGYLISDLSAPDPQRMAVNDHE